MGKKIQNFVRQETVLVIAALLAAVSCFFVLPDRNYISYIDWRTMILLFCLMAVMAGVKEMGIFHHVGETLLKNVKSKQGVTAILVGLCFLSSMIITNDVALITFIPFGILVLKMADMDMSICFTVTLMTIAANLGSMLTPIGNPQNLYLYSVSGVSVTGFVRIMLPYTVAAAVILILLVRFGYKKEEIVPYTEKKKRSLHAGMGIGYGILFLLCLLCVMGRISPPILLGIIVVSIAVLKKELLLQIDYGLLATFFAFFIFIGNMGRLPALHAFLTQIMAGREEIVSIAASQVISNVPAALLLSGFSQKWTELIVGTNLGGLGTLIASMASLISYKQIALQYPEKKGRYLVVFTLWNILFLAALYMVGRIHIF